MTSLAGMGGVAGACAAAGLSRAGFYRRYQQCAPRQSEQQLRDLVQRVALGRRTFGYRRVQALLRERGVVVNHKRVLRLMREDNLLSLRRRRFVLTTDSRHPYFVYPNHAAKLTPSACDQLWVADITYIRLAEAFVYLAVVLDAFSRRVIGWALDDTLEAKLAVTALERALQLRHPPPGVVHHSDRGVQYCCRHYIALLEAHAFLISMSRKGNPYDNAKAESFMKTLKAEEVHLQQYRNRADAEARIAAFLEEVYNRSRPHSALGYLSPEGFEQRAAGAAAGGGNA